MHTHKDVVSDEVYREKAEPRVLGRTCRDGTEALLAGGIPDLELYSLPIDVDRLHLEINAGSDNSSSQRHQFPHQYAQ